MAEDKEKKVKPIRSDSNKTKVCKECDQKFWSPYLQTVRCPNCKMKDEKQK